MQVDYAFLCDAAAESGGKIHALGIGFERITVRQLPAVHPRAVAVVRFAFNRDDLGARPFRVRVSDGDGRDVSQPVEGQLTLQLAEDADRGRANMVVELLQLDLQTAGPHEVSITVGGRELAGLPFEVFVAPS
ncbi:MAG: hypothetical protein AB7F65_03265 [Dehalococcoidia bacterium]